ncbi:lipoyl(octanoyl) transferase LipB [Geobacter pickeringii]|uniref:Octanoyltransferase n=1 Tax=Geobacter pickeringii TaxID=345632 RepID=A0A0B5BAV9_9BACT|nr:lipoyl(octanoyl) transferase LipB [Geobacter pickeringii]AJE03888.1 octanoyltransferase [Geobacter pickeringii]
MKIRDLGLIDFAAAFAIQERLAAEVAAGGAPETLLLLEHPPVYTIGRGGRGENILDPAIAAVETNRGGDVTYHGPGQLVGYPIIDLGRRGRDLHHYLRFLEEVLIRAAADFGVAARRVPGRTGVWTEQGKLASIGVGVRRWVTMHGFALNVATDPAPFSRINPCGIAGCPVTSLDALCGRAVSPEEAKRQVAGWFRAVLDQLLTKEVFRVH